MTRWAIAALLLGAAACSVPEQGTESMPPGDVASFADTVQPAISDTCGTLDCHGNAGRPLRIYALYGLRLSRDLRNQPITDEEIAHNAGAFVGISPGVPIDDNLVLLKPLSVDAGGMEHVGGDLWPSKDDPNYLAVRAWLAP